MLVGAAPARGGLGQRRRRLRSRPTRRTPAAGASPGRPPESFPLAWGDVPLQRPLHRLPPPRLLPRAGGQLGLAGRSASAPAGQPPQVLNLFGYTGVASLVCAAAGRRGHPRRRLQEGGRPGRARTPRCRAWPTARSAGSSRTPANTSQREVRRGSNYDGIILDPPKYGRGPTGEVWRLFEDLPELLGLLRRTAVGRRLLPAAQRLRRAHLRPVAGAT